jgi:hypothetical protein
MYKTEVIAKVPINSLPPGGGGLGWGGEVSMKSVCCSFTHPLTPSRQGRGNIFGRVLQLPQTDLMAMKRERN